MVESQDSPWNRRTRSAEDERFIESFKNYVDLLVDESCNEIKGDESVPKEKFEKVGQELVEASRKLKSDPDASRFGKLLYKLQGFIGRTPESKMTRDVKNVTGMASDLAEHRRLVPTSGGHLYTPSGNSVHELPNALKRLEGYFLDEAGLTLYSGIADIEGRLAIDLCLGDAKKIKMPVGPKVTVFAKLTITRSRDTMCMRMGMLDKDGYSDWTNSTGIYHQLEPKLKHGKDIWSVCKPGSGLKFVEPKLDKLYRLAWTALSLEAGNEETFSKKYAAVCIENSYFHEINHNQIAGRRGSSTPADEAAAQLYAISRANNPFNDMVYLYGWKTGSGSLCARASGTAFHQLEKAGYTESLWNGLDAGDTEKVKVAGSEIRKLADLALTNLETDLGWKNHNEVERELGLKKNYSMLHGELQKLEAVEYGK